MNRKTILLFCATTLALGWVVQGGIVAAYGNPENAPGGLLASVMLTPLMATLLFAVLHRPSRPWILWKPTRRTWAMLLPAVLVPTLIGFATIALAQGLGWGHAGWFVFAPDGVQVSGGPWLLGRGTQGWGLFVANVLVTGAWFAAISTLPAIGEELGWRGFLQGLLVRELGTTRGLVVLGLVWSAWHLPSLLAGYNYPDHPVLGALVLFPLLLVGASLFLGWLTLRAGSFWPAAVAHGAGNSIEIGVISNLKMAQPQLWADLLHIAVTLAVGLLFLWALRRKQARSALALASQAVA